MEAEGKHPQLTLIGHIKKGVIICTQAIGDSSSLAPEGGLVFRLWNWVHCVSCSGSSAICVGVVFIIAQF